jgi:hypothetical protein
MLIPWTMLPLPRWFKWLCPLGITHSLKTYLGDEKDWVKRVNDTGCGEVNQHYIFFTDDAGTTWNGDPMPASMSQTLETFVGPAIMIFHIPFTIGKSGFIFPAFHVSLSFRFLFFIFLICWFCL